MPSIATMIERKPPFLAAATTTITMATLMIILSMNLDFTSRPTQLEKELQ